MLRKGAVEALFVNLLPSRLMHILLMCGHSGCIIFWIPDKFHVRRHKEFVLTRGSVYRISTYLDRDVGIWGVQLACQRKQHGMLP